MKTYPLTVLMIGPGAYRGRDSSHSTFMIWRELAAGFKKLVVVARARGRGESWSDGGVNVILIRGFMQREVEFLLTQFAVLGVAYRARPDVVVSQGVALGGWAAILVGKVTGARSLIEVHSDDFVDSAPLLSKRGVLQRLAGGVFRRATLIRVLTPRMGQALGAMYGGGIDQKIRVLPPRVDLKAFAVSTRIRPPGGRLTIGMVATLNENKGQLRLVRLLEDHDLPIDVVLVGDGPDRDAILSMKSVKSDGSNVRTTVCGLKTHSEVSDILARCDIFVSYSYAEGTPRSIMEAMATGLPVITTNVGFCADIVEDGVEGYVLGDHPDRQIIPLLKSLCAGEGQLETMGKAASHRARRDFDSQVLYPRYRELIAEAASLCL